MDLTYFKWIFSLDRTITFWPIAPTHSTPSLFVAPFVRLTMSMQGEVMLQQNKYSFGNYGISDAKGHLWMWNKKLAMWGHQNMTPFHILHNDYKPCLQPLVLGMLDHPNPRYK
jgi:hypothetical protein